MKKRYNEFENFLFESGYSSDERHSSESQENIIRDYAKRFQIAVDGYFNSTTATKIADTYLQ